MQSFSFDSGQKIITSKYCIEFYRKSSRSIRLVLTFVLHLSAFTGILTMEGGSDGGKEGDAESSGDATLARTPGKEGSLSDEELLEQMRAILPQLDEHRRCLHSDQPDTERGVRLLTRAGSNKQLCKLHLSLRFTRGEF